MKPSAGLTRFLYFGSGGQCHVITFLLIAYKRLEWALGRPFYKSFTLKRSEKAGESVETVRKDDKKLLDHYSHKPLE